MADVNRFLNRASSAGGDGTTNNTSGATRAFASMSEAEANMGGSATDNYTLDCCGSSADTTGVTWDFSTNLTSGTLTVRANASDGAGKYNGTATISTSHYRISVSGAVIACRTLEANTTFDGLQIVHQPDSGFYALGLAANLANQTAKNNRILDTGGTAAGFGINAASMLSTTVVIENNLVVGFDGAGINVSVDNLFTPNLTIRHNTVYGNGGTSDGIRVSTGAGTVGTITISGNACANAGDRDIDTTGVGGSVTLTTADNATEDATGQVTGFTPSNVWTSPSISTSADFTVKDTSSAIYNIVNPTLVTLDITGYTRDGTNHDAGCFELQSAGTQTIVGSGIASTVAFGTLKANLKVVGQGVASTLAFGTAKVNLEVALTGISSTLAFGTLKVNQEVELSGIASTLVFGEPVVSVAGAAQTIIVGGIASTVAFGTAEVSVGGEAQSLLPSGITSTLAFGSATLVFEGNQTLTVSGISPTLAFGSPTILGGRGVTPGRLPSTPRVKEDREETRRQRQRFGVLPPDPEPSAEVDREARTTRPTRVRVTAGTASATFDEISEPMRRRREEEEVLLLMAA